MTTNVFLSGGKIPMVPGSFILTSGSGGGGALFDYYVSTTGADTNPGTLASPWAITSLSLSTRNANNIANCHLTAGKRVGFLPGTYDISGLMLNDVVVGAIQLIGGSSAGATTYWGSSNASGQYVPRTATLDMKGASGLFGGGHSTGAGIWDGPGVSHTGQYPSAYALGFATIDGLRFTGWSYKGVRIGAQSSGDGPAITNPVLITNCEFFGGGFNAGDASDNCCALWTDHHTNAITITNNWFHDSVGHVANSGDHFNAINAWGSSNALNSTGLVCTFNTLYHAANIFGKEGGISGSTITNNYVDMSDLTTAIGGGIQDWTGNSSGSPAGSLTTIIANNIVVIAGGNTASSWDSLGGVSTDSQNTLAWRTPALIYNNTVVNASASGGAIVGELHCNSGENGVGAIKFYNNIYYNQGGGSSTTNGNGTYRANPQSLAVFDYNLNPSSGVSWVISSNGAPGTTVNTYTSAATFSAAYATAGGISGTESHSVSGVPTFTGTGLYAAKYQLNGGSLGQGTGYSNGTGSGGSACDMGAWGGASPPSQIGCNFAT